MRQPPDEREKRPGTQKFKWRVHRSTPRRRSSPQGRVASPRRPKCFWKRGWNNSFRDPPRKRPPLQQQPGTPPSNAAHHHNGAHAHHDRRPSDRPADDAAAVGRGQGDRARQSALDCSRQCSARSCPATRLPATIARDCPASPETPSAERSPCFPGRTEARASGVLSHGTFRPTSENQRLAETLREHLRAQPPDGTRAPTSRLTLSRPDEAQRHAVAFVVADERTLQFRRVTGLRFHPKTRRRVGRSTRRWRSRGKIRGRRGPVKNRQHGGGADAGGQFVRPHGDCHSHGRAVRRGRRRETHRRVKRVRDADGSARRLMRRLCGSCRRRVGRVPARSGPKRTQKSVGAPRISPLLPRVRPRLAPRLAGGEVE